MWHAHLARDSRAGRPCHFPKLHRYLNHRIKEMKNPLRNPVLLFASLTTVFGLALATARLDRRQPADSPAELHPKTREKKSERIDPKPVSPDVVGSIDRSVMVAGGSVSTGGSFKVEGTLGET